MRSVHCKMIEPLMKILNLPLSHLFAIPLIFDDTGEYAGFDISADTADMNGKAVVVEKCVWIGELIVEFESRFLEVLES